MNESKDNENYEQFNVDEDKPKKVKKGLSTFKALLLLFSFLSFILLIYLTFFKTTLPSSSDVHPLLEKGQYAPVLVADIGGTNCRLRLIRLAASWDQEPEEIKSDVLKPWEFKSIELMLKKFLSPFKNTPNYPLIAVIGVPGPIIDNTLDILVNIPNWSKKTKGDELARKLGLQRLIFLNDFVCNGYGIQSNIKEGKDYININGKPLNTIDKKFIIGPGTGLGVCYLIKNEGEEYYNVYGSEGSHQDFAPKDLMDFEYLQYLKKYYNEINISTEKACAGPALIPMYQYLKSYYKGTVQRDEDLGKELDKIKKDTNKDIINPLNKKLVEYGLSGKCPLAKKVLEYFIKILGNITGNMSILTLPYGGIYVVGSLATSLEPIIEDPNGKFFINALLSRGELNQILEKMPIILVKNSDLGMLGAIECARIWLTEGKI